jgi:hypothetical protein
MAPAFQRPVMIQQPVPMAAVAGVPAMVPAPVAANVASANPQYAASSYLPTVQVPASMNVQMGVAVAPAQLHSVPTNMSTAEQALIEAEVCHAMSVTSTTLNLLSVPRTPRCSRGHGQRRKTTLSSSWCSATARRSGARSLHSSLAVSGSNVEKGAWQPLVPLCVSHPRLTSGAITGGTTI